jgi:hypothetical protein
VADTKSFAVGDMVAIRRPTTVAWIKFMGMDNLRRDGRPQTWIGQSRSGITQRIITAISGNRLTVDIPLADSYDATYLNPPGTIVTKIRPSSSVSQVGIEHLHIQCPPLEIAYGQAPYSAIRISGDDCWVKDVYCEETMNSTTLNGKRITMEQVVVKHTFAKGAALEAIEVDYDILPFASTLQQVMSPDAPDLRPRRGKKNVMLLGATDPHHDPNATWVSKHGDVEKGFQEADVIKEFTYSFAGATAVPMQPVSSVAKWDGDKLTFWGMGQGIYPQRDEIARALRIDPKNIRYINKWNGCTFGSVMAASRIQPFIAHIAKMAGRPVKIMLNKDQEFSYISIKPETITKFKVGAKKDGRIVALVHEIHISAGAQESAAHATTEVAKNNQELYTADVPHWKSEAAWVEHALRTFETPPQNGPKVSTSRLIAVLQGWDVSADELKAQISRAEAAGALGIVVAEARIDQGWEPRIVSLVPNSR